MQKIFLIVAFLIAGSATYYYSNNAAINSQNNDYLLKNTNKDIKKTSTVKPSSQQQTASEEDKFAKYNFTKLNSKVWVMHGPLETPNVANQGFMNNPAIIIAKSGIIIVDPGSTYQVGKMVLEKIAKISSLPVIGIFNTHVHGDHWLANQAIVEKYPKVLIYANPQMIKNAKNGEGNNWVNLMLKYTDGASAGTKPVYPNIKVYNGDNIGIDGESFLIYSQDKSHTDNDIMVAHLNSKTLFLGDNAFVNRMGRFDSTSSIYGNIKALAAVPAMNLDYFVPGHGPSGSYEESVKPFADYLKILESVTKQGYENDLEIHEIKANILQKTQAYLNWTGFKDGLGKQVSKMYLEIENLDF